MTRDNEIQAAVLSLSTVAALPLQEAKALILKHGTDFLQEVMNLIAQGWDTDQVMTLATRGIYADHIELIRMVCASEPVIKYHSSACIGCQHYYGGFDGGNRLICAMHPYGPKADTCADWEAIEDPIP